MKRDRATTGTRDAGTVILHLVTGACLLFSLGLIANNIHPTRRRLEAMKEERARLEQEIRKKKAELEYLSLRAEALQRDGYTIDRELRQSLRLTPENEQIIRIGD